MMNAKKPENNQQTSVEQADYSALNFRATKSKPSPKAVGSTSKLTIVNTAKNGKRLMIADELLEVIGADDAVQIAINDEGIAIGNGLPDDITAFNLRKNGKKGVIYSTELVEELTDLFALDFSDKSSVSFPETTYLNIGDQLVAFIALKKQEHSNGIDTELDNHDQAE
ncbi:hypothetical protein [Brevibacillus brevis]|uniref:hypothetical protein n=1 Tax=Brevibacillus brevis TaxID=1393 RepID=UPI000D0EE3AA|nr:hypothetical protein [Brevibacillus brevis]PSJ66237.1 hypothetical protein C7J99_26225 [Brevibacillus brevis]RED21740.1 hypothetical protein DES34_1185 [Brevibacillus brevis]GEC92494.1 hypothetical protein BBR01nite_48250 [Brevibacillus brevis]VEF92603.1 Uncharacterised protein [Brevibacillus brevis]